MSYDRTAVHAYGITIPRTAATVALSTSHDTVRPQRTHTSKSDMHCLLLVEAREQVAKLVRDHGWRDHRTVLAVARLERLEGER